MGIFKRGDEPMASGSAGGQFWRPDAKAAINRVFILNPTMQTIVTGAKYGTFKVSGGPTNASWVDIGRQDVGNLLGLKAQNKAFVWVLVPNDATNKSKGYEVKLWECGQTQFNAIATGVNEFGLSLQGMMVVLKKDGNRWTTNVNKPPKAHEVEQSLLETSWQEVVDKGLDGSDEEVFGKIVGLIPTQELQKKFLIERIQREDARVTNWNGVLRKFGIAAPDDSSDEEESDVEEF